MQRTTGIRQLLTIAAMALACFFPVAHAQPGTAQKPIRIVVPVAGGTMDLVARQVAGKLAEEMGRSVIVENKPGAGGVLANDYVAKGPADGTTLLIAGSGIAINATMNPNLPYDTLKDFMPVTNAVSTPLLLVVHKSVPVKNVAEFIEYVRAHPGFNYASIGAGTQSHLTMEMFKSTASLDMVHVAYKGAAPAVNDLLAGHVKAGFFVPANVVPHVGSGQLKALASTGRGRVSNAPTVPTMIESGFSNFEVVGWIGVMVRSGTPVPIVNSYQQLIVRALESKQVRERLTAEGFDVNASTAEEFGATLRSDMARWGEVVRRIGVVGAN